MSQIKIDILQQLIDHGGEYLLANRYLEGMGASRGKDTWETLVIAPDVPRELWGKKLQDEPFKIVDSFANQEIKTIIHLGKNYSPFQYGIRNKDFISLEKIECVPMELVVRCWNENETDYYKIVTMMDEMKKGCPE